MFCPSLSVEILYKKGTNRIPDMMKFTLLFLRPPQVPRPHSERSLPAHPSQLKSPYETVSQWKIYWGQLPRNQQCASKEEIERAESVTDTMTTLTGSGRVT